MVMLIVKYGITALIIVGISEFARNSEKLGAFIGALPIVTFLILFWIYFETKNTQKIAEYSTYTFWYVLPTLPSFLIIPWLLTKNINFYVSILISAFVSLVFFVLCSLIAKKFNIHMM